MSSFLEVKCKCENVQVVFEKPAGEVKCRGCGDVLATPTGGHGTITGKILKKLD